MDADPAMRLDVTLSVRLKYRQRLESLALRWKVHF
jgi:hypothetical protein